MKRAARAGDRGERFARKGNQWLKKPQYAEDGSLKTQPGWGGGGGGGL